MSLHAGLGRRRLLLAAGAAATAVRAQAAADGTTRITIGETVFAVPDGYVFGEIMPPGTTTGGLPPHFSFAFTMPDGAPAGSDLEFPPITKPFQLERDGGRYLVMCYRVAAGGPNGLNVSPRAELASVLSTTDAFDYAKIDGMLAILWSQKAGISDRYDAVLTSRDRLGVTAFVTRVGEAQFFYGNVELERPNVVTVMYIPQERISLLPESLNKFAELLTDWSRTSG